MKIPFVKSALIFSEHHKDDLATLYTTTEVLAIIERVKVDCDNSALTGAPVPTADKYLKPKV